MMINKNKFQDDGFIARWISQDLSETEAAEFEQWLASNPEDKKNFEDLKNIWDAYGEIKLKQGLSKEERWQKIRDRVYLTPESRRTFSKSLNWRNLSYAAAAVIVFGFIYTWWNTTRLETVVAHRGSKTTATLPDGSEVTLNAESSIKYSSRKWQKNREVLLAGEAFFKVEAVGTTFSVKADLATTEVLGTSFNVKARGRKVEVSCVTGKVSVKSNKASHNPVVLRPGFASTVVQNQKPSAPYQFNIDEMTGWTIGEIYFQSTPLPQVFDEISRQFDIDIDVKANIANLTFTGRITDSDLNQALETVCLSSGLKYQAKDESAFIITN